MDTSNESSPALARRPLHLRALALAGLLFALFAIAAGLNARYGYPYALRVFETHQRIRAADAIGKAEFVEYEDYLRVDPANLFMRGLLINQLIEFREPERALEVAHAGIDAVPPDQREIATLLVARALMANGRIDEAEKNYRDFLENTGASGEAHYGLAHVAAARGDFKAMRAQYRASIDGYLVRTTPDLAEARKDRPDPFGLESLVTYAQNPRVALSRERRGELAECFLLLQNMEYYENEPSLAHFLRGVYEEEQGRPDAALRFYKRAADDGDALAAYAVNRLSSASGN